eukprot:GHVU01038798.1.p2 GENE.GHVU01038798.1~~GHVU01038798.1.p2  ORF type:complete len:105 (-),score=6.88 GHVU01038798.1:359-673(-)
MYVYMYMCSMGMQWSLSIYIYIYVITHSLTHSALVIIHQSQTLIVMQTLTTTKFHHYGGLLDKLNNIYWISVYLLTYLLTSLYTETVTMKTKRQKQRRRSMGGN